MPVSKTFIKLLDEMKAMHEKKSEDYASSSPYENFERAAIIASWFNDPVDRVFATMIGIKLARLAVLKNSKRAPNNESVADSHLDMTVYSAIWAAYERDSFNETDDLPCVTHHWAIIKDMYNSPVMYRCLRCKSTAPINQVGATTD